MRPLIILCTIFLLNGCATPGDAMASLVGRTRADVIAEWGPPNYATGDGAGGQVLIYEQIFDANQVQGPSGGSRQPMFQKARRMIYVNAQGKVYRSFVDQPE